MCRPGRMPCFSALPCGSHCALHNLQRHWCRHNSVSNYCIVYRRSLWRIKLNAKRICLIKSHDYRVCRRNWRLSATLVVFRPLATAVTWNLLSPWFVTAIIPSQYWRNHSRVINKPISPKYPSFGNTGQRHYFWDGRNVRWPRRMLPLVSLACRRTDRRTDKGTPDRSITLSACCSQRHNVVPAAEAILNTRWFHSAVSAQFVREYDTIQTFQTSRMFKVVWRLTFSYSPTEL